MLSFLAGMFSKVANGVGLSIMYSLTWFLGSTLCFMVSGGRTAALRFWPTAVVLGFMTATVHVLAKCVW